MVLVVTTQIVRIWPTIMQLMMVQMSLTVLFKWQVKEFLYAWVPLTCLIRQMFSKHVSVPLLLLFQKFRLRQEYSHSISLGTTLTVALWNVSSFCSIFGIICKSCFLWKLNNSIHLCKSLKTQIHDLSFGLALLCSQDVFPIEFLYSFKESKIHRSREVYEIIWFSRYRKG